MAPAEAIEDLGRATYGEAWSGTEAAARAGLVTAEEYDLACVTPGTMMSGSGAGGGWGTSNSPRAELLREREALERTQHPERHWPYGDPHDPTYQAERAARTRWQDTIAKMLEHLATGARKAISLDRAADTPRPQELAREFWFRGDAAQVLSKGRVPKHGHYRSEGELFIAKEQPGLAATTAAEPWRPDGNVTLKAWCKSPVARTEARRRTLDAVSSNPSETDVCKALARMWEQADRGPAKWTTIQQYLIANRNASGR